MEEGKWYRHKDKNRSLCIIIYKGDGIGLGVWHLPSMNPRVYGNMQWQRIYSLSARSNSWEKIPVKEVWELLPEFSNEIWKIELENEMMEIEI